MSDDLVKQWDEYVESMGSVMGDVEHMTQQMRDRIEALTAERDGLLRCVTDNHVALCRAEAAEAERDRLREALEHIAQWSEAYPTEVFPEPDFAQAASALSSSGMSIDAVSASNMRHATKGVGKIARAALKGETP